MDFVRVAGAYKKNLPASEAGDVNPPPTRPKWVRFWPKSKIRKGRIICGCQWIEVQVNVESIIKIPIILKLECS